MIALLAAIGLVVIGGGAFGIYWFAIREKPKKTTEVGSTEPRTLYLSKSAGGAMHFATFQDALKEFKPGDTIVIKDDVWEEQAAASGARGLTLTSQDGKRVVWRAPGGNKVRDVALLALSGCEGARISGITFDAAGIAPNAVRLHRPCGGLILEDVEMLDARDGSLVLEDCTGQQAKPVTIRKTRFFNSAGKDGKAGVRFLASSTRAGAVAPGNQAVHFQACTFDGALAAAFQFEGTASAIDIRHCRVKTANGLVFKKVDKPSEVVWRVDVTNNTFLTPAGFGVLVEDATQVKAKPENRLSFTANYFIGTPGQVLLDATNAKFLVSENQGNLRKAGSQPGVMLLTGESPVDLPADGPQMLSYDKSNPLNTAFNGKPVGAPPE